LETIGQSNNKFVDTSRPHSFFNCISSSLISSSSCSLPSASVTRNNSTNSESSTINSQLITTTTSSLLAASGNEQQTQLFNEREHINNYSTIKVDRGDEYKQLTNHQNRMPICYLNLRPVLTNDGHYLQAVPINLDHYQLQQQHQLQQSLLLGGDYAEISSQCGTYNNYNQCCETDAVNRLGPHHCRLFQMPNVVYHPVLRLDERENSQRSLESLSN
jgi:hypothetical protein